MVARITVGKACSSKEFGYGIRHKAMMQGMKALVSIFVVIMESV